MNTTSLTEEFPTSLGQAPLGPTSLGQALQGQGLRDGHLGSKETQSPQQIAAFLNTILNFSNTSTILHDILASKSLEIVVSTPIQSLIHDNFLTPIESTLNGEPNALINAAKERCRQYVITELTLIKRRYLLTHNHNLKDPELIQRIPSLVQKWIAADRHADLRNNEGNSEIERIEESNSDSDVPQRTIVLTELNIPLITKNKNNKEQGLIQFVALCREVKTITSSVDMYNNYRRWCLHNGYGYYSSPTLTKYLRYSDKRPLESVSEKGRSQGWYLQTP